MCQESRQLQGNLIEIQHSPFHLRSRWLAISVMCANVMPGCAHCFLGSLGRRRGWVTLSDAGETGATLAIGTRSFSQKISKVSGAKPISYFRPVQTRLPEIQWQEFLGLFCPCFLEAQAEEWEQQGKKLKAGVSPHNTSLPGHRSNSNSFLASLVSCIALWQVARSWLEITCRISASSTPPILL